jgi:intracellular septation protein A
MANTQAMCTSFKVDLLNAVHAFNGTGVPAHTVSTADTFKAALYVTTATVNAATTAYSSTNEVTGTNYTAGGVTVTFGTAPSSTGTTAFITPSASIVYTTVTLSTSFDCVLIYNSTQSNKAVSVHTFTAQTVTAGTFTLTMPTNDATTGLIRLA